MYINNKVTKLYQYSKLKITTTLFSSYCIFCTFFFWSLLLAGTIMLFFFKTEHNFKQQDCLYSYKKVKRLAPSHTKIKIDIQQHT